MTKYHDTTKPKSNGTFNDQAVEIIQKRTIELQKKFRDLLGISQEHILEIQRLKAEIAEYQNMLATRQDIPMDKDGILDGPNGVIGYWRWCPIENDYTTESGA